MKFTLSKVFGSVNTKSHYGGRPNLSINGRLQLCGKGDSGFGHHCLQVLSHRKDKIYQKHLPKQLTRIFP